MKVHPSIVFTTTLIAVIGCQTSDLEVARQAIGSQAAQNQAMANLQREVAAGARELVASDADARRGSFDLQRQIQAERTRLSTGWDELQQQRQREARSQRTESFLTALVQGGSGVAAALFALAALRSVLSDNNGNEAELAALLLEEAASLTSCRAQAAISGRQSALRPFPPRLRALRGEKS